MGLHLCSTQEQVWPCLAHVKINREKQRKEEKVDIQKQKTKMRSHVNQNR